MAGWRVASHLCLFLIDAIRADTWHQRLVRPDVAPNFQVPLPRAARAKWSPANEPPAASARRWHLVALMNGRHLLAIVLPPSGRLSAPGP